MPTIAFYDHAELAEIWHPETAKPKLIGYAQTINKVADCADGAIGMLTGCSLQPHTGETSIFTAVADLLRSRYFNRIRQHALALAKQIELMRNEHIKIALDDKESTLKSINQAPQQGVWFTNEYEGKLFLFWHPSDDFKCNHLHCKHYGRGGALIDRIRLQNMLSAGFIKR